MKLVILIIVGSGALGWAGEYFHFLDPPLFWFIGALTGLAVACVAARQ